MQRSTLNKGSIGSLGVEVSWSREVIRGVNGAVKLRMCGAGLADANGYESAPQSASAQDGMDTNMAAVDGWAEPGTTMGASWGQGQDDDGIEWEPADNAENVEPGSDPRSPPCAQPALVSGLDIPSSAEMLFTLCGCLRW